MESSSICEWITKKGIQCSHTKSGTYYCKTHARYEGVYMPHEISELTKCISCCFLTKPTRETRQCTKCFESNPIFNCKWVNRKGEPCSHKALSGKTCCKSHSLYEEVSIEDCTLCTKCRIYFHTPTTPKCPTCYPPSVICPATKHDGTMCTQKRKNGCTYCGHHRAYEGVFTPEELTTYPKCSTCRLYFKCDEHSTDKVCSVCCERARNNRKTKSSHRTLCQAFHPTGEPCKFGVKPGKLYCEKHKSYGKYLEETRKGVQICSNWIRGCWNECDTHFVKCTDCRLKERISYKGKKEIVDNIRETEKTLQLEEITCVRCRKKYPTECFIHHADREFAIFQNERVTVECYHCRSKARFNDTRKQRDRIETRTSKDRPKDEITRTKFKYYDYRRFDIRNGHIDKEDEYPLVLPPTRAYELMLSPCTYCGKVATLEDTNGLDRLDNTKGHSLGNVVPCCSICNIMKQRMTVTEFTRHIIAIAKNLKTSLIYDI